MSVLPRLIWLALLVLGVVSVARSVDAQQGRQVTKKPSELVDAFTREYQGPGGQSPGAASDVAHVLTYPDDYPSADLEVFLQGLEKIALTGQSSRLRASATFSLSFPGSRRNSHPVPGTVRRLERIYQRSSDPAVRGMVVASMADVAEKDKALMFLERVATQVPVHADFPGSASRALGSLVAMDEDGRAVLRRLHETKAVRDPEARHELSVLADRGYKIN